jgi:hypothetical protein
VGYAESDDGINWTKPRLEGFPFGGYDRTNIVMTGRGRKRASGMQVMLNPDPSDPQRRFLGVYVGGGVDLAYSPDGLHWTVAAEPLFPYHSDFPNHLLWVPEWSLWYLYVRPSMRPNGTSTLPEGLRHTGRRLALTTSKDLENWTMPRTVLYPDERDEPDYDSAFVFRRHGLFLALYAMMHQEDGGSEAEPYLAASRDGIHWERTWDRQPLIPRGPEGSYDHGQIEPGNSPPVELGDDLLFYYYTSPYGQKEGGRPNGLSADAPVHSGRKQAQIELQRSARALHAGIRRHQGGDHRGTRLQDEGNPVGDCHPWLYVCGLRPHRHG